jgi:acyl carrier protein
MGLDTVEIVLWAEKEFDLQLPDDEVSQIYTVGEYSDYLHRKLKTKHGFKPCLSNEIIFNKIKAVLINDYAISAHKITRDAKFIADLNLQ